MFKRLFLALRNPRPYKSPLYPITVRCARCGEEITTHVNLHHDLSRLDEPGPQGSTYFSRKMLVGNGHCFQRVEVSLYFDQSRKLTAQEISGGALLSHG
ncbi:MAG: hypothetical protein Fur0018_05280 [Anaerolineales bacterium]